MPISSSRSEFVRVRGLRFHVRIWGRPELPALWLMPGLLDTSATWEPVASVLAQHWQVHSPDARGMGHTEWPQDGYWFPDYVADLDALLQHYSPNQPVLLVGHSMGAQVSSLFAGLRPDRVSKLVCLDGLFLPDMETNLVVKRYRRWLDDQNKPTAPRSYASFEELSQRVRKFHPHLDAAQALFIAQCWGQQDGHGRIRLLADPKHYLSGPGLYRAAESMAIWKEVAAPTLFLDGGASSFRNAISADETAQRRGCFRIHEAKVIDGAGHMLHFDRPGETAGAIRDFLTRQYP